MTNFGYNNNITIQSVGKIQRIMASLETAPESSSIAQYYNYNYNYNYKASKTHLRTFKTTKTRKKMRESPPGSLLIMF